MKKVDVRSRHALHNVESTRHLEIAAQSVLPPHTLMQRAGLAVAKLALALVPHGKRIWVACGPGNNGGDGFEAAYHLRQFDKHVIVTCLGTPETAPNDALASCQRALASGVEFAHEPPRHFDLAIDALLGIGATRAPMDRMAHWINLMNSSGQPVLAIDVPTGLQADTGARSECAVVAHETLSLLTLKPGLFTAQGRDLAGSVWFDDLGVGGAALASCAPIAWLGGEPARMPRLHVSHKGIYGDLAVIGGASGMSGAALLAGSAALHAGAGRVYVCLLDHNNLSRADSQPELMFRAISSLDFRQLTIVCGCGGGESVRDELARAISTAARLVLDADAINHLSTDSSLELMLTARHERGTATVLTPHPLEAARLLCCDVDSVQANRIGAANELAKRFGCCVVLKGSGSIIALPGAAPIINPTGNPRLATPGSGDVLAGMIGAGLARGLTPFQASCEAVYRHGLVADQWPCDAHVLTADTLSRSPQIWS